MATPGATQFRGLVVGFLVGSAGLGLLIEVASLFIFGRVSTDVGRPLIALGYAPVAWGVLGLMSTSSFGAILWTWRRSLPRIRRTVACGVLLGGAAGIMAGMGLTPSLGQVLFPRGGRISWLVVSALPGIAVALVAVTAMALGGRIAGRRDEVPRGIGR